MASSNDEHLLADHARRVEPSGTWSNHIFVHFDLVPPLGLEVEDPEIVHVG